MILASRFLDLVSTTVYGQGLPRSVATPNAATYRFLSGIPSSFCPFILRRYLSEPLPMIWDALWPSDYLPTK